MELSDALRQPGRSGPDARELLAPRGRSLIALSSLHRPAALGDSAFWDMALKDILAEWDDLSDDDFSDPANPQSPVMRVDGADSSLPPPCMTLVWSRLPRSLPAKISATRKREGERDVRRG